MNLKKLKEVLADEAFVKKLFTLETAQEVQEVLSQKGVELTVEEIEQAADFLNRYQAGELSEKEEKAMETVKRHQDGELSEEELEEVAGGFLTGLFVMAVIMLVGTIGIGTMGIVETCTGRW